MARGLNNLENNRPDRGRGGFFGVRLDGFGFIPSLVMALCAGFIGFFAITFLAIVGIGIYDAMGHSLNLADSYKYISFPAGCLIMVVSLSFFGTLWLRGRLSRR